MQALQHVYDMDRKWYLSVNNDFATNGNIGNLGIQGAPGGACRESGK